MKPVVYVLRSETGRYYYGSTTTLDGRLAQHGRGHTSTTARGGPWKLHGWVECVAIEEARRLERTFKRWKNPARVLRWLEQHGQLVEPPG